MAANYKLELTGVFGHPVAENPTCVMQEAAFAALDLPWRYLTIEVTPDNLPDAIRGARAFCMKGINLTIPHKVAVMPLLDEISKDAAMIGAVNTVRCVGNRLVGENTDGKGFLRGVREDARIDPAGKRVLILGAGGAARAISFELALAGVKTITIANRSPARGIALAEDVRNRTGVEARFEAWEGVRTVDAGTDILINATPIGLFPNVNDALRVSLEKCRQDLLVCDVVPNPPETRFIQTARQAGLRTLTGLSMLVYQGAIGFEMWTGRKAPENAMRNALEKALKNES
jgi:shikimate dehydrogenase